MIQHGINKHLIRYVQLIVCIFISANMVYGQDSPDIQASIIANASSGEFAPYFISALNHGKITQKSSAYIDLSAIKHYDSHKRIDIGYGVEVLAGMATDNDYAKWDSQSKTWTECSEGPSNFWIQQLYAEIKYRSIFISAGLKEYESPLVNHYLSSGDFVESGNARPIPQIKGGFNRFVNIPYTNGWLQINGAISMGVMPDDNYLRHHYNYYSYHLTENTLYNYKYCYFRTNPDYRFSATFGIQGSYLFGGKCTQYNKGEAVNVRKYKLNVGSFANMIAPVFNFSNEFVEGSSLGSWDFKGRYRLSNGDEVSGYFQWPFEDGSGMAKFNKLDGIWGLEYNNHNRGLVSGFVVEYIDFRDQSGPVLFAPGDFNNPTITANADGNDNYYNNGFYNSYANYGMSIGSPFMISPIYNTDGYPGFKCTRTNGMHVGIDGYLMHKLQYRALFSYQRGLGTYDIPYDSVKTDTSMMIQGIYSIDSKLTLGMRIAYDHGKLRGNNFGTLISLSYKISK